MVLSMDSMLLHPKAKVRYSDDVDVAGDAASEDAADRLPQEILLLIEHPPLERRTFHCKVERPC